MSDELRLVWVCGDGCGLRVRDAENRPIPEPKYWEASRCFSCRIERERQENGPAAANALHDRIRGFRKRPGPFGHRDPDFSNDEEPEEPKQKRRSRAEPTPEQRDRIDAELENTFDTDRVIAKRIDVPVSRVAEARDRLKLPQSSVRRVQARQAKLNAFLAGDPARLDWTAEDIAAALDSDPNSVRSDRLALGLGIGRGNGQRSSSPGPPKPKPRTSHSGKRGREERLARVREFVREHPDATNPQVAEALGLDRRRVGKDRLALGMTAQRGKHAAPLILSKPVAVTPPGNGSTAPDNRP